MAGLYIHIPFCKSRCIYCGFFSTTLLHRRQSYVDALCEEMRLRVKPALETIYIGGGTPSLLTPGQLRQLFDTISAHYPISADAEVTMECNPDDVTPQFVGMLPSLPIDRVSVGIQTFNDQRLRFLHRRHTATQAKEAVHRLREGGISNISIDLIFAFPNQSVTEWDEEISQALSLKVEHISSYSLMIEENTPLWNMRKRGELNEVSEDCYMSMYELLCERLSNAGYEHYEISNFAQPGRRSRHNSNYWNETPYLGIGAAAHSYDRTSRQWNVSDIDTYISAIQHGIIPSERETLGLYDRYNDLITTSLRTSWGLNLSKIEYDYGNEVSQYLSRQASKWLKSGHLMMVDDSIRLTLPGIFVSDTIMSDLVWI